MTERGPSKTKAVLTVEETLQRATDNPGEKILYSVGHTKYGGRVKAHDIRTGRRGPWRRYLGLISTSALQQEDGTYAVFVYVTPEALAVWSQNDLH